MKSILCFGDSNTWGYDPVTKEQFSEEIRWTGLLREKLKDVNIIEDGVCGRTTVYKDKNRPGIIGIESIRNIFVDGNDIDGVVLMLGTNDCKSCFNASPKEIARGINMCLDIILEYVLPHNVLLVSPIHLGEDVWKENFDPEFNETSVAVSKGLKNEYLKIAQKRNLRFIAASDHVQPSTADQEHLSKEGHFELSNVIYNEVIKIMA